MNLVLILVYVDDLILASKNHAVLKMLKDLLFAKFEARDLGKVS